MTEEAKPSKEQPTPKKPPEPNGGNKTAKVKSPKESSKGSPLGASAAGDGCFMHVHDIYIATTVLLPSTQT